MAKYIIDSETLEGLGDAIRSVTGSTKRFTPEEMIEEVKDILNTTTFILVDEGGNEYPAVYIDSDTVITATANDIRKGITAVTSEGVVTGEKEIPAYITSEGRKIVTNGSRFILSLPKGLYDYTKLQAIFCPLNKTPSDSVAAKFVAIDGHVYAVDSTTDKTTITLDHEKSEVDFGFENDSGVPYVIRYFSYKEVY